MEDVLLMALYPLLMGPCMLLTCSEGMRGHVQDIRVSSSKLYLGLMPSGPESQLTQVLAKTSVSIALHNSVMGGGSYSVAV